MSEVVEPETTQQPEPVEPIPDTQEGWEKRTDEDRQKLLEDATNEADPTENIEPETVPEEETPEPTPPVKAEEETPEPAPVEETPEPPAEPPKHKSIEELQKANESLEKRLGQQGTELGQLRQEIVAQKPEPETVDPYAGIKTPDAFVEGDMERYTREVQAVSRTEAAEIAKTTTTEVLQDYENARPVAEMIASFQTAHPDLSPARVHGVALYADEVANAAGKSCSLDEAFDKMYPGTGNNGNPPPVEPEKPPVQPAPQTLADTPTTTPPRTKPSRDPSQADWDAKSPAEREAELRDIPTPPEGQ